MINITINLPEKYMEALQILVDNKIYANRSDAIRNALKDFLQDELNMYKDLENNLLKERKKW